MLRKRVKLDVLKETHTLIRNQISTKVENTETKSASAITSPYFEKPFWQKIYDVECRLSADLKKMNFLSKDILAVYNPLEYASEVHCNYMEKYLDGSKSVIFIGMNPGPWGMVQTGVPFGYIPAIRDWLKLSGTVNKPEQELAIRPVNGLQCDKSEVSGQRFWGLLEEICGQPEQFFRNCFVYNLCPLAFFGKNGRNITPPELKPEVRKQLQATCGLYLKEAIDLLSPTVIVSIGRYTEDRVKDLLKLNLISDSINHKCMPHPSPRSLNNQNWNEKAKKWLVDNDIMQFMQTN